MQVQVKFGAVQKSVKLLPLRPLDYLYSSLEGMPVQFQGYP